MLPLLTRLDHVGIACRDLDRAVALYQATFGLEVASLEVNEEQGVREAMLRVGAPGATVAGLRPGRYSIQASFPGFDTRTLADVRVRNGDNKQVAVLAIARVAIERYGDNDHVAVASLPGNAIPPEVISRVTTASLTWNDSLDDEIALAAATLDLLSSRNRGFDGSLLQMNERLEALSHELSVESL